MSEVTDIAPEGQEEVITEALDENISNDEDTEIETPDEDEKKDKDKTSEESEEIEALKDAPDWVDKEKWLKDRLYRQDRKHKRELDELARASEVKTRQEKAQFNEVLTEEQKQEIQRREIEMQNLQFQVHETVKEQEFAKKMQEKAVEIEDFSENILQLGNSGNFSDTMLLAAKNSPNGPDILYHLSKNQKEAARISRLPLEQQVREMYLTEAGILNRINAVKSSAPPPLSKTKAIPKSKAISSRDERFAQAKQALQDSYKG